MQPPRRAGRAKAEERLLEAGQLAISALDSLPAPIAVIDADGRIATVNRAWEAFRLSAGGDPAQYGPGANYTQICEELAAQGVEGAAAAADGVRAVLSGERETFSLEYRVPGTEDRWYVSRISPLVGTSGGAVVLHGDITDLVHQALHDPLTGLPNRELLHDRLDGAIARARRERGILAMLIVDLDNFKVVNDAFGHSAGDDVLVAAAQRLSGVTRPGDTVARLGGDEFVILCEGLEGEHEAKAIAERVVHALDFVAPLDGDDIRARVTVSVGVVIGGDDVDVQTMLRTADAAMYEAKARGRNRAAFSGSSWTRRALKAPDVSLNSV